ncbi:MAG TPA: hypothetical protein VNF08_02675 [Acidimicrobiales bacterium]|nr:hypothetical protein [Acidimicrobiales bacterium]
MDIPQDGQPRVARTMATSLFATLADQTVRAFVLQHLGDGAAWQRVDDSYHRDPLVLAQRVVRVGAPRLIRDR